ncbi:hypothetical protein [Methylobacterium aquaticum]|uniref:hypothetical protein n=1 Tax=Methylobacterium aquaticum TaxID=270351 RepID=UPI0019332EB5|nr:hypothetical protein [Methylobacterium aquaticum]QRE73211.1 hypothetical protein F1D61_05775 [Methylobacterium aquaticum]
MNDAAVSADIPSICQENSKTHPIDQIFVFYASRVAQNFCKLNEIALNLDNLNDAKTDRRKHMAGNIIDRWHSHDERRPSYATPSCAGGDIRPAGSGRPAYPSDRGDLPHS